MVLEHGLRVRFEPPVPLPRFLVQTRVAGVSYRCVGEQPHIRGPQVRTRGLQVGDEARQRDHSRSAPESRRERAALVVVPPFPNPAAPAATPRSPRAIARSSFSTSYSPATTGFPSSAIAVRVI